MRRLESEYHPSGVILPESYYQLSGGVKKPSRRFISMIRENVEADLLEQPSPQAFDRILHSGHLKAKEKVAVTMLTDFNKFVLHEDQDLLVLNKPPGIDAHYSSSSQFGVAEVARQVRGLHVQPAHRLDSDTSGVFIFAKSFQALMGLSNQFADKEQSQMEKRYLTLLDGKFETDETQDVHAKLVKRTPTKMHVLRPGEPPAWDEEVKDSHTLFTPLYLFQTPTDQPAFKTLTDVQIMTGRTHQIRVVAAEHLQMPVTGDHIYNPDSTGAPRQMLHATKIVFSHPRTSEPVTFQAGWPQDFQEVLDGLEVIKAY